jgi:uncharacterized protein YbaR (Trm112 family)
MEDMRDINMELPVCPICEAELEYTEFVYDDCDGDVVWFKSHGYCPRCGKEYRWYDKYNFAGITLPECVGEREV